MGWKEDLKGISFGEHIHNLVLKKEEGKPELDKLIELFGRDKLRAIYQEWKKQKEEPKESK